MKNFFNKKVNTVLSVVLVLLSIVVTVQTVFASSILSAGETEEEVAQVSRINPAFADLASADEAEAEATTEPTEETTAVEATTKKSKTTEEETTEKAEKTEASKASAKATTEATEQTIAWATAITTDTPADYNAQWEAGYLIAIDNPDTTYECGQVTLCDEDRDLLERLCMGEFGSGGFIGAALIAQAVKNAMCFDGYTSVQSIIDGCHYTGSTEMGTNDACVQAVKYIFDENHDAVQHRIMYMYNPQLVSSAFHESQNYILTYQNVRFFDRWNY